MKNSVLFASAAGIVNSIALNLCNYFASTAETLQIASNISQVISPFVALFFINAYTKIDHPPALIRQEAAIAAAIKICRKHLHDKDATEEFKEMTRKQLTELMLQQQKLRVEFEKTHSYSSSLERSDSQQPAD
jgi:hypothetical protein